METTIYSQGIQCGAGWAFATADAITSAQAITKNSLISLSQQQLVSCMGVNGCTAGNIAQGMIYTLDQPLAYASVYKYTNNNSANSATCAYQDSWGQVSANGAQFVEPNSAD